MSSMSALRLPAPLFAGRVLGIPIRLDWSWIPMIPVYSWAIAAVYLPGAAPDRPVAEYWIWGVITTFLLVVSVVAHELAHAVVARVEGLEIHDITVHFFGGMARMSGEPSTPSAELKIAVVGPGASFALGIVFLLLDTVLIYGTPYLAAGRVLRHLGLLNIFLATFNLLPGFPLDGGRVLRAVLWRRRGDAASALRTARSAGRSIAISLLGVGLYVFWLTDRLTGVLAMSMGAVLMLALGTSERTAPGRARANTIADLMRRPPVTVTPTMTVHELVNDVLPTHKQTAFLVTSAGRLHGVVALESLRDLPRDAWRRTSVADVMHPVDETVFVDVGAPLDEAWHRLLTNGLGHAAVLDADGLVVGSLRREDLDAKRLR
jgi:Zn-dependent protease/CBS domain-containing protein